MKRGKLVVAMAAVCAALVVGCGGDVAKMLASNPQMQEQVMGAIGGNSEMAGKMIDHLMTDEGTRKMIMDKLMGSGEAMKAMMSSMAANQTMVDGIINLAVQDSTMRGHVMTLFKGMEMGSTMSKK